MKKYNTVIFDMDGTLFAYLNLMTKPEFWQQCLESFQILGPLVPILLAAIESLIPALPLVAIVTLNVAAHGAVLGFVYSWIGTCAGCIIVFWFFRKLVRRAVFRLEEKRIRIKHAREWVSRISVRALFLIAVMPFTPSVFLNFAFGVSDFDEKQYIKTIVLAKVVMIMLLAVLGQSVVEAMEDPRFLIPAGIFLVLLWLISKKIREKHEL